VSSFPKVFVYGTLKRGFGNHHFLAGAKFLGTGTTKEKFAMYSDGGIPFVVKNEEVCFIHGELYMMDKMCLRNLDRLEGHPRLYKREEIAISLFAGDKVVLPKAKVVKEYVDY
jgi:gamma-glutamylaminecyclotransferase